VQSPSVRAWTSRRRHAATVPPYAR
jgi:hypothetical protein